MLVKSEIVLEATAELKKQVELELQQADGELVDLKELKNDKENQDS